MKSVKNDAKIIVGGRGVINKSIAEEIGADGYGSDASQAVNLIRGFIT